MKQKEVIITIPLRVASKKNNRRNFGHVSLPSKAYEKFHSLVAEYLLPYRHLQITTPFQVIVNYEIKGKYHQDVDNVLSSVLDCLQDYGVIINDDMCSNATVIKVNQQKEWKCTIHLFY
jgi:Holliday junction resolvase RusA-like endonuclease